jgi:hypothetical protein
MPKQDLAQKVETLLARKPSKARFDQLLGLLRGVDPSQVEEWLPTVSQELDNWKSSLRKAHISSLTLYGDSLALNAAFQLVHSVDMTSSEYLNYVRFLELVCHTPSAIRSLTLDSRDVKKNDIRIVLHSPLLPQLHSIQFAPTRPDPDILQLLFKSPQAQPILKRELLSLMPLSGLRTIAKEWQLPGRTKMDKGTLEDALFAHLQTHEDSLHQEQLQEADMPYMGELRELLSRQPSESAFLQILDYFEHWPYADTTEDALAYARQHLTSWPDDACQHPDKNNHYGYHWPIHVRHPAYPLIRSEKIQFTYMSYENDGDFGAFQDDTSLSTIRQLMLNVSPIFCKALEQIIDAPQLNQLQELNIMGACRDGNTVDVIERSERLRHLSSISFTQAQLDLQTICASPNTQQLKSFGCECVDFPEEAIHTLVTTEHMKQLEQLTFSSCRCSQENICELVSDIHWPALTSLGLNGTQFQEEAAEALIDSPLLPQLTSLALRDALTGKYLRALMQSPAITGLRRLDVGGSTLKSRGLDAILKSPYLTNLTSLHITSEYLGANEILKLLRSPLMSQLKELSLSYFDDECASVLASSDNQLTHLESTRKIGSSSSSGLPRKDWYSVQSQVSEVGVKALATSSKLAGLTSLQLGVQDVAQQCDIAMSPQLSQEVRYIELRKQTLSTLKSLAKKQSIKGRSKMDRYALCRQLLASV